MNTMNQKTPAAAVFRGQDLDALNVFGTRVTVLGGAGESGGVFSLARVVCAPGTGAPPHTHVESEHFYVLRGRLAVRAGTGAWELQAGDVVHIPPHLPHEFGNPFTEEAEFLAVATPAGHERFFRGADELARSNRFNPETAAELCAKNGITLIPPSKG